VTANSVVFTTTGVAVVGTVVAGAEVSGAGVLAITGADVLGVNGADVTFFLAEKTHFRCIPVKQNVSRSIAPNGTNSGSWPA
jgi:hypothetical protein